jgi:hypothetical protein
LDVEKHRVEHTVQLHRLLSVSTEGGVLGKAGRLRSLGDLNKANAQPQGLDDSNEKVSIRAGASAGAADRASAADWGTGRHV